MASLTLLIVELNENDRTLGKLRYVLPVFLDDDGQRRKISKLQGTPGLRDHYLPKIILAAVIRICFCAVAHDSLYVCLPAMFTLYLIYGFIRPRISSRMRHDIEEEDDEARRTGAH